MLTRRMSLATAALSLLAISALAANAVHSGLKPGTPVPAFDVVDVSGPNKGKQLCYRCSYGGAPVVAAFIKGDAAGAANLVQHIQTLTTEHQDKKLRSFVVFMGGPELKGAIEKVAAEKKITIPMTFLPAGASAEDIAQYKINPEASNTVLLWHKGTVRANVVNVDKERWAEVTKATQEMLK